MITLLEDYTLNGYKLYIMKTPTQSFVLSIPKLNWSTEIDSSFCDKQKLHHICNSLIFQMYDGDCSTFAEEILTSITHFNEHFENKVANFPDAR
ncbi:MAG TPA: YueH family protein [Niallia sp.]|nr:YueH family protein [Niallia sp.]